MTRIMFPFLLLVALAAQAMGVLNASNSFGVPALASTFFNIGSVGFGVVFGIWLGPSLHLTRIDGNGHRRGAGRSVATGAGSCRVSIAWDSISASRSIGRIPVCVRIFRLMAPAILGNAAVQINVMVNTNFASTIADPVRGMTARSAG